MTKTLMDRPEYYYELYNNLLESFKERKVEDKLRFWKWEKDILVVLLEKATEGKVKRKYLRRKVNLDLKKITSEAWKELREGLKIL